MILNIRYNSKPPEQIQGVGMTSVYPNPDYSFPIGSDMPMVVIHFKDERPIERINLNGVECITITND